jgi:hypothetical protein
MASVHCECAGERRLPCRISSCVCQRRWTARAAHGQLWSSWSHQHCPHKQLAKFRHSDAKNSLSCFSWSSQVQNLRLCARLQLELVSSRQGESRRCFTKLCRCWSGAQWRSQQRQLCKMRQRSLRSGRRLLQMPERLRWKSHARWNWKSLLLFRRPFYRIFGGRRLVCSQPRSVPRPSKERSSSNISLKTFLKKILYIFSNQNVVLIND